MFPNFLHETLLIYAIFILLSANAFNVIESVVSLRLGHAIPTFSDPDGRQIFKNKIPGKQMKMLVTVYQLSVSHITLSTYHFTKSITFGHKLKNEENIVGADHAVYQNN